MEAVLNGSTIEFQGLLDERTSMEMIRTTIEKASSATKNGLVRLNFSGVKRANSVGILAWARFVDKVKVTFLYVDAPEWLVEQFNLCDILKNSSLVESFQAPFYCPETDSHSTVTLVIGKDVPIREDYTGFQINCSDPAGAKLEADFEPHEYFHFIARNAKRFRGETK